MIEKTILVIGTYDTKEDELVYLESCIHSQGGKTLSMDVSVLGNPSSKKDISKTDVALAGGSTIKKAIDSKDENTAMQIMAAGASKKAKELHQQGVIDAVIILGGTMGTDLALDVCKAIPVGVPKYVISTVAFSPMLPPERLAADIQMILWAGGLYGLNSICKSSLSQAAGAILGAAKAVESPNRDKPLIGMTSFGKTILHYMITLKPALEDRGFDVAVFHATGMGGRAFEALSEEKEFAAVMDFTPQEICNEFFGSGISAGKSRLTKAGINSIPQLIAPACYDLVDLIGWQDVPDRFLGRESHNHNRLITSVALSVEERRQVARLICEKLASSKGHISFFIPTLGCNEWERPGSPLYDEKGLKAFIQELKINMPDKVKMIELDCHINDKVFCNSVLEEFDRLVAENFISQ